MSFFIPSTSFLLLATVMTVKPGEVPSEVILLLRNVKNGPIIQVSYYPMENPLSPLLKNVRCICRINYYKRIQALKIQELSNCNTGYIARLSAISNHALKEIIREQGN